MENPATFIFRGNAGYQRMIAPLPALFYQFRHQHPADALAFIFLRKINRTLQGLYEVLKKNYKDFRKHIR